MQVVGTIAILFYLENLHDFHSRECCSHFSNLMDLLAHLFLSINGSCISENYLLLLMQVDLQCSQLKLGTFVYASLNRSPVVLIL